MRTLIFLTLVTAALAAPVLEVANGDLTFAGGFLSGCGNGVNICNELLTHVLPQDQYEYDPVTDFAATLSTSDPPDFFARSPSVFVGCTRRNICNSPGLNSYSRVPKNLREPAVFSIVDPNGDEVVSVGDEGSVYLCDGFDVCAILATPAPTPLPTSEPTPLQIPPTPAPISQPQCPSFASSNGVAFYASGVVITVPADQYVFLDSVVYFNAKSWTEDSSLWLNNDQSDLDSGVLLWTARAPSAEGANTVGIYKVLSPGTWYLRARIPEKFGVTYVPYTSYGAHEIASGTYPYNLDASTGARVVGYTRTGQGSTQQGTNIVYNFCNFYAYATAPPAPTPNPTPTDYGCPAFSAGVGWFASGMVIIVPTTLYLESFAYVNDLDYDYTASLWLNRDSIDLTADVVWSDVTAPRSRGTHIIHANTVLSPGTYFLRARIPVEVTPLTAAAYGDFLSTSAAATIGSSSSYITQYVRSSEENGTSFFGTNAVYHFCSYRGWDQN